MLAENDQPSADQQHGEGHLSAQPHAVENRVGDDCQEASHEQGIRTGVRSVIRAVVGATHEEDDDAAPGQGE